MKFSRWWKLQFTKVRTPEDFFKLCETPEEVGWWLTHKLHYTPDEKQWNKRDYWETPQQVIDTRRPDCDGFAILAHAWCKVKGYNSRIMVYWFKDLKWNDMRMKAHAICVFSVTLWLWELGVDGLHQMPNGPFFTKPKRKILLSQEFTPAGKPIGEAKQWNSTNI